MNYNKKTVKDVDVKGKKVLLRCDFNVPMAKDGSGVITDDKRIRAALPTIQYLLDQGAAVIACSHMGKPKGEVKPELSLKPVAVRLGELLGKEIVMAADVVGAGIGEQVLVVSGSTARKAFGREDVPMDMAIVGIVDSMEQVKH